MQRSLANSVVPGEPPVSIVTEHCAVSIHKDEAASVVSKVSEDGRSSINFPAWCDMAPQPCSDKDVITLSVRYAHLQFKENNSNNNLFEAILKINEIQSISEASCINSLISNHGFDYSGFTCFFYKI